MRPLATAAFIIEGDPGDFMVLVLEGFVEVFKKDTDGGRSLVGVAAPGKTLATRPAVLSEVLGVVYARSPAICWRVRESGAPPATRVRPR